MTATLAAVIVGLAFFLPIVLCALVTRFIGGPDEWERFVGRGK